MSKVHRIDREIPVSLSFPFSSNDAPVSWVYSYETQFDFHQRPARASLLAPGAAVMRPRSRSCLEQETTPLLSSGDLGPFLAQDHFSPTSPLRGTVARRRNPFARLVASLMQHMKIWACHRIGEFIKHARFASLIVHKIILASMIGTD